MLSTYESGVAAAAGPQPEDTQFKFVFCDHVAANAHRIAEKLEDCDVIAFEAVGPDAELRSNYAETLSAYVSKGADAALRKEIEVWATKQCDENDDAWDIEILKYFLKSDKKVELIDIGSDDPEHDTDVRARKADDGLAEGIMRYAPLKELVSLQEQALVTEANSFKAREAVDVRQLERLASKYPGMRIGVLPGAVHTAIFHDIAKKFSATRTFALQDMPAPGSKVVFRPRDNAIRAIRFNVPQVKQNQLAKIALLDTLLLIENGESLAEYPSEAGVDAALNAIDRRYANIRSSRE